MQAHRIFSLSRLANDDKGSATAAEWAASRVGVSEGRTGKAVAHRILAADGPPSCYVAPLLEALCAPADVALYELARALGVSAVVAQGIAAHIAEVGRVPLGVSNRLHRVASVDVLTWCRRAARGDASAAMQEALDTAATISLRDA